MEKQIALITGATSGIGLETAKVLAQNGYALILTGRREERLAKLATSLQTDKTPVLALCFDIRSATAVEEAINGLPPEWQQIDLLVNNAGLAAGLDTIDAATLDDWEAMIDTNIKGLLYITRLVSRKMMERQRGHIIQISSIAGREAYPKGSVYCATKHAVYAISKAMRIELAPYNIKVSTVSPGAVNTEFSAVRFKGDWGKANQVYDGFDPLVAKDIAETILFIVSRPAHVNIDDILIMPTAQASARDIFRK